MFARGAKREEISETVKIAIEAAADNKRYEVGLVTLVS
jgi:hypothetical protein